MLGNCFITGNNHSKWSNPDPEKENVILLWFVTVSFESLDVSVSL